MSPSNLRGHKERKTWKYKLEFIALYIISILSFGEVKAQENINFYLHENGVRAHPTNLTTIEPC